MSTRSASKGKATGKVAAVDLTLSSDEDATPSKAVAGRSGKASNGKSAAPTPKKGSTATAAASASNKRKAKVESDSDEYDDEDDEPRKPPKKRPSLGGAAAKGGRGKAKVEESSDDEYKARAKKEETSSEEEEEESEEEESSEEDEKPKKKAPAKKAPAKKAPPKKTTASASKAKTKKEENDDDVKMEDAPIKKPFKWNGGARAGPSNPGSKEVPEGTPNCFGGLTFVFTGELESLGRDECTSIAKRYGGRVTTSVSSKTSYVVIGSEPGESKLKVIKANKIPTLDEDGFLRLIVTRSKQKPDKDYVAKREEEMKKIKTAAKAITVDPTLSKSALWTVKYAPQNLKDLCGNKGQVEKMQAWLEAWPKNRASNFTKPGKDGLGTLRACLLSGPPGIGKTTSAHLVARLAGFKVIEMNASDTRSKKLLEAMLKSTLDNTVLDGFMTSKPKEGAEFADLSSQSCLIMDEVDGTSGGDRGGIGALVQLIKKTKIPIICIANDKSIPKMKPLLACCNQLPFKRPTVDMIRSRLMTVAFKEGMKIDKTVSDQLVQGTQADIRQIINILSTWKLTSNKMTYDETKALTDLRDPNALATPFTLMDRLFAPQSWGQSSGTGASQKLEVYFQEFDVLPLFVQENYLKHKYTRANAAGVQGSREYQRKMMELTSKAADAISDGDLVDRMIHGTQQHWTLMPVHGMMSTVTPSFHCYGMGGYGGGFGANADASKNTRMFPSWFGKNSTQGRLQRLLTDIQIRMRLKVSGDRREIRQSYIPVLFNRLLDPLVMQDAEGIPEIIELMDEYYLTKEEWDGLMELGIGENTAKPLLDKVKTTTKSAFTRKYNSSDHPIPFHKGTDVGPMKKMAKAEKPDFEEAFEDDVGANDEEEEKKPTKKELEGGIQDKLVKEKKPKGAAKKAAAAPKKAPAKKK